MIRRTLVILSTKASRTIIRDPRKAKELREKAKEKARTAVAVQKENTSLQQQTPQQQQQQQTPMAFEPSAQNQESLGIGSYMLAGAGMALGFTLVGALFGGI
jgi:uncharacterized protein GlcG (DUF336 family)